jgi:putative membrane protein
VIDYDPHDWRSHLLDIKGSMVRQISHRVLLCVAWSALVVYVHKYHVNLAVSDKAHTLIGVALGLLLVVRTNASYDRFWEGRKQWGSIINETRNLGRAASVLLADAPDLLRTLLGWTTAFPYAAMHSLRGSEGLGPAADWLPAEDVAKTLQAPHLPLAVSLRLSEQLAEGRRRGLLSDYAQMTLDNNVQLLIDYLGSCERIHRTPLPFAYVVHLRRALIVYCFTLPFAVVEAFGWAAIPATLFLAYTLYGMEEIGVQIEDPFGVDDNDLPLERFCAVIEDNLLALLPEPAGADGSGPVPQAADPGATLPVGSTRRR